MTKPISASSSKKQTNNNNNTKPTKVIMKTSTSSNVPPGCGDVQKWTSLFHNGVIFPPPYRPHGVKMLYKGHPVELSPDQEEVATMYAVMLDNDYYMNYPKFKDNFMADWQKILGKDHVIQSLEHCDFTPIYEWHQREKEMKKQMTIEEKKALKEEKVQQEEKYMWAIVDGVKEKVENFRVDPPGLFRGRGQHPKNGKLKKRIRPSDITINIGKDAPIPDCPFPGESWKKISHDNTVTWLARWNDPIKPNEFRYVCLAGRSEKEKYDKARLLKNYIQGIRAAYTEDFTSDDVAKRQIAVATYLIDKLALRVGNEKDEDSDLTFGCCTLKVENFEAVLPNLLKFDYVRYKTVVEVEPTVFEAIQQLRSGKISDEYLFDKLDISTLNAHLNSLMPGLTAKVFHTYNASITLDDILSRETKGVGVAVFRDVYHQAYNAVANICNLERTIVLKLRSDKKTQRTVVLHLRKKIGELKIDRMECDEETKVGPRNLTRNISRLSYLDPRITFAWCKRNEVPIEKIFNKSLMAKFGWASDVDPGFRY